MDVQRGGPDPPFPPIATEQSSNDDDARGRIALADVDLRGLAPVGGSKTDRSRNRVWRYGEIAAESRLSDGGGVDFVRATRAVATSWSKLGDYDPTAPIAITV